MAIHILAQVHCHRLRFGVVVEGDSEDVVAVHALKSNLLMNRLRIFKTSLPCDFAPIEYLKSLSVRAHRNDVTATISLTELLKDDLFKTTRASTQLRSHLDHDCRQCDDASLRCD